MSSLLGIVFTIIIAFLVLFILFQIVKAVFDWIGKSGDEKARAAAIKSITNAVIAGIVLIIALLVVVFGSKALNIGDIPALAYGCYNDNAAYRNNPTDGSMASGAQELQGVTAYEGTGTGFNTSNVTGGNGSDLTSINNTLKNKVYCKDDSSGQEYGKNYKVGKKVSVQKGTAAP